MELRLGFNADDNAFLLMLWAGQTIVGSVLLVQPIRALGGEKGLLLFAAASLGFYVLA